MRDEAKERLHDALAAAAVRLAAFELEYETRYDAYATLRGASRRVGRVLMRSVIQDLHKYGGDLTADERDVLLRLLIVKVSQSPDSRRARRAADAADRRSFMRSEGICPECNGLLDGQSMCDNCLADARRRSQEARDR